MAGELNNAAAGVVAITLPCTLFVISLVAVFKEGSAARKDSVPDILWTGVAVMVNVMACFWAARILSAASAHRGIPPELAQLSTSSGVYFFGVLAFALYARHAIPFVASTLKNLLSRTLGCLLSSFRRK